MDSSTLKLALPKTSRSTRSGFYTGRSGMPPTSSRQPLAMSKSNMSESRRKKLEQMKEREELKGRRSRLQAMLVHKLYEKYARRSTTKRGIIEDMVTVFVINNDKMTEQKLIELEVAVRDKLAEYSIQNPLNSSRPETGRTTNRSELAPPPKIATSRANDNGNQVPSTGRGKDSVPSFLSNDWVLLDAFKAVETDDYIDQLRKDEWAKKMKQRAELDKQMNEQRRQQQQEEDEKKRLREQTITNLNDWKKQQNNIRSSQHGLLSSEKDIRLAQIKEKQDRLAQEKKDKLARENREIKACQREMQRQKQREHQAKEDEKEKQRLIKIENEVEFERRRQQRLREDAEDKRLMEEYKAKLEREENERKAAFNERVAKMLEAGEKFAKEGAGAKKAEFEKKMDDMIFREAAAKEKADQEREDRDKAKLKSDALRMNMENQKMVELQRKLAEKEMEEEKQWAASFRKEGEDYVRNQRIRREQQLERERKEKEMLMLQMEEIKNRRQKEEDNMTTTEKSLNSDVLKVLNGPNGDKILERIQNKLLGRDGKRPVVIEESPIGVVNMDFEDDE